LSLIRKKSIIVFDGNNCLLLKEIGFQIVLVYLNSLILVCPKTYSSVDFEHQ